MSDPILLQARDRIKAILDELDIAGHFVLHNTPGSFEVHTKLDPSYSKITGLPPEVRLRSKLADYGGDKEAQRRDLEATANMVRDFGESMGGNALWLLELAEFIDAQTGAEHTDMLPDPD